MRRLHVDFNNPIGSSVLPVPTRGLAFAVGDRVAVYDDGTGIYEAVVLETSQETVLLEVSAAVLEEA